MVKQVDHAERARIRETRQRYYESLQAGTAAPENPVPAPDDSQKPNEPAKELTLEEARAKYEVVSGGQKASPKWGVRGILVKIEELEAAAAKAAAQKEAAEKEAAEKAEAEKAAAEKAAAEGGEQK